MVTLFFPTRKWYHLSSKIAREGWTHNHVRKTHSHNTSFFSCPNLVNSYYAGFIAADGALIKTSRKDSDRHSLKIQIHEDDREILDRFVSDIGYAGGVRKTLNKINEYRKKPSWHCYIQIHSIERMQADLKDNFAVVPNKTYRIAPPNLRDIELIKAYIVGYLDGDGCITTGDTRFTSGVSVSWHSCSRAILDWIRLQCAIILGRDPELMPKIYQTDRSSSLCSFMMSAYDAGRLILILRNVPIQKLNRKWDNPLVLSKIGKMIERWPHRFEGLSI